MADFTKPDSLSLYSAVWSLLHSVIESTVTMFDGTTDTNIPDKAKRYNTSTNKFQVYDETGGTWANLPFHTTVDSHIADTYLHHGVPVGGIVAYAANPGTAPDGFLYCRGQAVSRSTYSALFTALSTTYGAGDGSTTFNVPNLQQRFPLGKAASGTGATMAGTGGAIDHTHTTPAHTHSLDPHQHSYAHTHGLSDHQHTVGAHQHSVPGHGHAADHANATFYVDGGDHVHPSDARNSAGSGGSIPARGASGAADATVYTRNGSTDGSHVHSDSDIHGTVGNWNGGGTGVSGDSAFNTGSSSAFSSGSAGAGSTISQSSSTTSYNLASSTGGPAGTPEGGATTSTNNPPYLVVNYLIRY